MPRNRVKRFPSVRMIRMRKNKLRRIRMPASI
jgi:hypothetical protein